MIPSDAAERWFDLNGARVCIESPDPALIAPLFAWLEELSLPPQPGAGGFIVRVTRETPQGPPREAHLLHDGPLPEGTFCRFCKDGDTRWLVVPERLAMRYSIREGRAYVQVAPGAEALLGGSTGILLLDAVLLASRQILVHAAALRLPHREAAVLLLAPSGSGKTTTSLALALQGFSLLTDDAAVLTAGEADTEQQVWGLPRPLKVHRRTAQLLPAIGGVLGSAWNAEDEQAVRRAALQPAIDVPPPHPLPLAALVVLGPRVAGEHRLRPMPKADLLALVATDNIFCSPRFGVPEEDLARYRGIARAVANSPAFQVNVGTGLDSLSECLLAALG
jgi:hypothetical protein